LRRKIRFLIPLVVITAATLTLIGYSSAGGQRSTASNTIVFGTESDPILLDPALISDGPSLRATDQIFESLVGFKPGTTKIVPELATSWKSSANHRSWTFQLRKGVKFSDGTPFNAAAVCFNFNRWYNFPGPLQNAALTYYWQTVFGGFSHPTKGSPGPDKSLYKSCKTNGQFAATINLTRVSSSFIAGLVLPNFAFASPTALKKYKADAGTVDSNGVFHPTGSFATKNPVGSGPYMLKSWTVGSKLELVPNPTYWGQKAKLQRVIFRPIGDTAARLQALQSGELQGLDGVNPQDYSTVQNSSKLKLVKRPIFSVGYVGMNQSFPPLDNPLVRQAVAYGLDRASIVPFYSGNGKLANQFLPPALFGFAKTGVPNYTYDPDKAKALLKQAGLATPVKLDFWYPTDVSRPYMPDPKRNAEAFGASLEKAGFSVTFHSAPWSPDYKSALQAGKYQIFLFGWIADYADPADFLNIHFGSKTPQFGFTNAKLFSDLAKADAEPDADARTALYQQASVEVMKYLPVVPYIWAGSGLGFTKAEKGFVASPIGPVGEPFSLVSFGA
jgi:peptide/nickel transport system substrate-binding protein